VVMTWAARDEEAAQALRRVVCWLRMSPIALRGARSPRPIRPDAPRTRHSDRAAAAGVTWASLEDRAAAALTGPSRRVPRRRRSGLRAFRGMHQITMGWPGEVLTYTRTMRL